MHLEDKVVRLYHFTSMTDSLPAENVEVFMPVLSMRESINFALSEIFSTLLGSKKQKCVKES